MALRPLKMGIFARMLLTIAPAAMVPLVFVIALSSVNIFRSLSEESFRYAEELTNAHAANIAARLGAKTAALRTLAETFSEFKAVPAPYRRSIFSTATKATLRGQSDVLAAWTQWEAGAIEDDPLPYRGTPLSAPNGGFNSLWYRSSARGTVLGTIKDTAYSGSFYTEAKERLSAVLVQPYWQSYTGKPEDMVFETTISVPIIYGGEFKGAVGFDIEVGAYQRMVESISLFKTGYAALVTDTGVRISHPVKSLVGTIVGDDLLPDREEELLRLIAAGGPFSFVKNARATGVESRIFAAPIHAGTALPHWILLVIVPLHEVTERADRAITILIILGIAALLIVLGAIFAVSRELARPIIALTRDIELMTEDSRPGKLEVAGADEVARLALSFNAMSTRLGDTLDRYNATNKQLEDLNAGLESKVAERTADLERTLEELRSTQDHMLKAEKFALLGQLSASVAHDLNTPLGAVKSSADFFLDGREELWTKLFDFAAASSPAEQDAFMRLLRTGFAQLNDLIPVSNRAAKKKLAKEMEDSGYPDADSIANDAESIGVLNEVEDLRALLAGQKREAIALIARVIAETRAGLIIKYSTEKAASTVSALVRYARTEKIPKKELVSPTKEIDALLVLYYGKMKGSIQIVRDYRCVDPAPGFRDKLNQVWVNLINNSLQAMNNSGTLEIRTERDGDNIAVSIIDSGTGIADSVKEKIFTPFFTTKPVGEGTGLGLDICRKIIETHHGTISFTSAPGRTVFTVRLPLKQ